MCARSRRARSITAGALTSARASNIIFRVIRFMGDWCWCGSSSSSPCWRGCCSRASGGVITPTYRARGDAMRRLLVIGLVLMLAACATPPGLDRRHWDNYQSRFISQDGRVVDTGNGGVSHSEGQGNALLMAVAFDDRARFEQLWRWPHAHLQVRDDHLFAWRWSPNEGVTDRNNASDGVVSEVGMVVNLSYWIFPAFKEFADVTHATEWAALEKSGLQLLGTARYGRWQLPPDWLQVGEQLAPAAAFAPRFSYDAVRIPLYLLWGGYSDVTLFQPYIDFWGYFADAPFVPAWTSLQDDSVDSYDAPPGFHAVMRLLGDRVRTARVPTRLAAASPKEDYYSASLGMLAHVVQFERGAR